MIEDSQLNEELETQLDEIEFEKARQFSSKQFQQQKELNSKKNNIFLSLTQLLVPCMGIGTLALPYCASKSGLIAEIIILSFSAVISCISMHLISWSSCKLRSLSYGDIIQTALGTNFRNLFDVIVILGTTLNCVNVQISFQYLIYQILQQLNFSFDQQKIMLVTQFIFTLLNLFFSLQRSLQRLKYISLLGLFSIIYLIGLINYEFDNKRIDLDQIVLFEFNLDILTTYTITFFCFVCHLFILPVMKNFESSTNKRQSQLWILQSSVCFIAYLLIIIAGYLNFQKDTQFWIINNFSSWQSVIGNIGISISLFFSVPFMMIASKNIIKDRLQRDQNDTRLVLLITIIQQIGTGVMAILFPEIKKMLSLLGGFTGTTTVCLFPLLIYMKLFRTNYIIIILEIIAIVLGYGGAIISQFQ